MRIMLKSKLGVALITSYIIIAVLATVGIGFVAAGVNELNQARRYYNTVVSFWNAESGLAFAMAQLVNDVNWRPNQVEQEGGGGGFVVEGGEEDEFYLEAPSQQICNISVNNGGSGLIIQCAGYAGDVTRTLQIEMPLIYDVFQNTLSGGKILFHNTAAGTTASLRVNGKTRLVEDYADNTGYDPGWTNEWFEDKQEWQAAYDCRLLIPDVDGDTVAGTWNDFTVLYDDIVGDYAPSEKVVIEVSTGTSAVEIWPDDDYIGKKIIYVRFEDNYDYSPNVGIVSVMFDTTMTDGQDMTIISNNRISMYEPSNPTDSRLSTISYYEYKECGSTLNFSDGVHFTNKKAIYYGYGWGNTVNITGNIISNYQFYMRAPFDEVEFFYSDRAINGDVPPGFERGLIGRKSTPIGVFENWQEI